MKRRKFIRTLGTAGLATGAVISGAPAVHAQKTYRWKMVTTWPKNFPGLGTGANYLADIVGKMSGGRLTVKVYGGGEIFPSLQSGAIDATEWVGPYNDLAFGFYKAASYYYWPGWHEPGTVLETFVNRKAYEELPRDLQAVVEQATKAAYNDMFSEFTARNNAALVELVQKHKVKLRKFPDSVLEKMADLSLEVVAEAAKADPASRAVFESFDKFRAQSSNWNRIGEAGFSAARSLAVKG